MHNIENVILISSSKPNGQYYHIMTQNVFMSYSDITK